MIASKLDMLTNFMIRPRRRSYNNADLGPLIFKSKFGMCSREDFQVEFRYGQTYGYQEDQKIMKNTNLNRNPSSQILQSDFKQGLLMKCSIFLPFGSRKLDNKKQPPDERICVLGLHGNTGSRMSTIALLEPVLKYGLVLAIFDFVGCGNSEGEHVTLGYSQKHQIAAVLQHIHQRYGIHKFMLYGRSMGASSSLFYCDQVYPLYARNKENKIIEYYNKMVKQKQNKKAVLMDIVNKLNKGYFGYQIIGLIMDSPYYDVRQMVLDIVGQRLWFLPNFITNYVLTTVNQRAKGKLEYMTNINTNKTENNSSKIIDGDKKQLFSIIHDVKIQQQSDMPFPVQIIYGMNDNVIAKNHTLQLFKRLVCQNKKLAILEGKGHGDHRDDQLKMKFLEWVLQIQYERISRRVCRDAQFFGMPVQLYTKHSCEFDYDKFDKLQMVKKQSMKQKATQASTERTCSLISIGPNQYPNFGSSTSLENYDTNLNKQTNHKNNHRILDQILQLGHSVQINQSQRPMQVEDKHQYKPLNLNNIASEYEQKKLLKMSRVAPFKQMRIKMGIRVTSKESESEQVSTKSKKE